MYQKKKGVLLIVMGVLLLLEFVALIISVAFALQLVLLSAVATVSIIFFFVDLKEEDAKKKINSYIRKLR